MALSPENRALHEAIWEKASKRVPRSSYTEALNTLMDAARAQGRQQTTTSTGETRPLSPANQAAVETVFGKPVMLDEEGEDWNALLDYVRAQGRASLEERVRLLEIGIASAINSLNGLSDSYVKQVGDDLRTLLATPGERENG